LDALEEKIVLLSGDVVGTHDADLLSGSDGSREDTTESVETSLIGSGHHLGDVHHQRSVGVAVSDSNSAFVVHGTFVEILNTVLLGNSGGWEMENNHFKKSVGGGKELLHDDFEEGLASFVLLFRGKVDLEGSEHLLVLGLLAVHDALDELVDWVQNELAESTGEDLSGLGDWALGPDLALGIEVVVTPEAFHELGLVNSELGSVHGGESGEGEAPSVKSRTESNGTL